MNMHFPQNQIARAESMLIARNDEQYLVPTDGGVLRGLIQDHVDAGVMMTSRDSFFTREEYIQLLYIGLRPEGFAAVGGIQGSNGNIEPQLVIGDNTAILTLPPAIMRPKALWTGKQIISSILLNLTHNSGSETGLNMISKSKIPAKSWGKQAPEEQKVIVMDGHLMTGILDKSQFGASANGLVHAVHQVYGPAYAGKLLTIFGRLFSAYLQFVGFSCRMDDLTLTPAGDAMRRSLINAADNIGIDAATAYVEKMVTGVEGLRDGLECVLRNDEMMGGLDSAMKGKTSPVTSEIISKCIPETLSKPFPQNNMQVRLLILIIGHDCIWSKGITGECVSDLMFIGTTRVGRKASADHDIRKDSSLVLAVRDCRQSWWIYYRSFLDWY
jgi:DNA-directed RNA polymerase I subunit RPA1